MLKSPNTIVADFKSSVSRKTRLKVYVLKPTDKNASTLQRIGQGNIFPPIV